MKLMKNNIGRIPIMEEDKMMIEKIGGGGGLFFNG